MGDQRRRLQLGLLQLRGIRPQRACRDGVARRLDAHQIWWQLGLLLRLSRSRAQKGKRRDELGHQKQM